MYEAAMQKKTAYGGYESINVKCPFCRAFSLIEVGKDIDYIQIDKDYQELLRDVFVDEFQELAQYQNQDEAHNLEYEEAMKKFA